MGQKEDRVRLIELLGKHERKIGELYKAFARRFPDHEDAWLGLSVEEDVHATWLRKLGAEMKEGRVEFREGRFEIPEIQSSLDCMTHWLGRIEDGEMSLANAFSAALDIENGVIEKEYYTIFREYSPELRHVFTRLANGTRAHIDRIQKLRERAAGSARE